MDSLILEPVRRKIFLSYIVVRPLIVAQVCMEYRLRKYYEEKDTLVKCTQRPVVYVSPGRPHNSHIPSCILVFKRGSSDYYRDTQKPVHSFLALL